MADAYQEEVQKGLWWLRLAGLKSNHAPRCASFPSPN